MPPMPSVSAIVWRRPYFLGISKSMTVRRLVAAHLDHVDGVVGAVERRAAVGGGLDRGAERRAASATLVGDDLRGVEALGVDVEERDGRVGQLGIAEDVAEQVLGEHGAARTDEGDLWH